MITGIEHLGIVSTDTARLKDWYIEKFGGRVVYDNGKGCYFLAFADNSMIEFVPADGEMKSYDTKVPGIRHIALGVGVDDFESMVDKMREDKDLQVVTEPAVNAKGIKTFFFRDPDGNIIHFIARPVPLV